MSYDATVLSEGSLIGYWKLDESSGTVAADSSGNSHPLTYAGGFTLHQTGPLAGSHVVLLDGISGEVSAATCAWAPAAAPFTWEFLVKLDPSATGPVGLGGYGDYGTGGAFNEVQTTDLTDLLSDHGDGSLASSVIPDLSADWAHIVLKEDGGGTADYWVNGVHQGSGPLSTGAFDLTTPLAIGNVAAQFLGGQIGRVALYGTALSDGRIAAHYAAYTAELAPRTVQLTDTIVNGARVPQAGITVTATLSVPGSAIPVDSSGREIDLTPLTDVTDIAGTYIIDRASGQGVIAPAEIKQNSGGTLIALPGCAWTISYLATTIVSPEFAWSGAPIHPSSWVAPFETLGRIKMWLTDMNGNGVVRPGVTFGCSVNANTTWTGGAGAGQLISSAGQFAVTTDSDGNIFLWVIRVSEFADAGRYYNLVELAGGSGSSATFVAPDTYTGDQGVYNGGTTYAAGAVVRRAADDVPVISQAGGNVGHALSDPTWWLVYNGEKVTLHTFLVGAPGTQVADTSMIAMADTTDAGDATAYAAPFTLAKQIKHLFYAIRNLLGAESLLSGKKAVIASPTSTQAGNIDMAGNITAAGELLSPLGMAAAHMAGYYATKAVTAAINANAGTGASVSHIEGGDAEGRITVVTGSGAWATGIQASVTFHTDYITATGVIVSLHPDDDATLAAWPTVRPRSIDGQIHKFDISFGVADTAAHTYKFKWHAHGE